MTTNSKNNKNNTGNNVNKAVIHRGINGQRRPFFFIEGVVSEEGKLVNLADRSVYSQADFLRELLRKKVASFYEKEAYIYISIDKWEKEVVISLNTSYHFCFHMKVDWLPEYNSPKKDLEKFIKEVVEGFEKWYKSLAYSETFCL
ncbi:MAG: hypothetical protein WC309_03765 [Candidatus Paceibacterota bacterium]|jgi:hypothetical protein